MRPYGLFNYAENMPIKNVRVKINTILFLYGLKNINCQGKNTVCCKNGKLIYYI